jgi:hypothetical protein
MNVHPFVVDLKAFWNSLAAANQRIEVRQSRSVYQSRLHAFFAIGIPQVGMIKQVTPT